MSASVTSLVAAADEAPAKGPACTMVGKRIVSLCQGLEGLIVQQKRMGLGVVRQTLINTRTRQHSRDLIVAHGPGWKDGIVFNVCPFCAQPLQAPDKEEVAA